MKSLRVYSFFFSLAQILRNGTNIKFNQPEWMEIESKSFLFFFFFLFFVFAIYAFPLSFLITFAMSPVVQCFSTFIFFICFDKMEQFSLAGQMHTESTFKILFTSIHHHYSSGLAGLDGCSFCPLLSSSSSSFPLLLLLLHHYIYFEMKFHINYLLFAQ